MAALLPQSPKIMGVFANFDLAHRCLSFTISYSGFWSEMLQSLLTFKMGLLMSVSAWLILLGSIQFLWRKFIWEDWLDLAVTVLSVAIRSVVVLVIYEFVIMKFPEYVEQIASCEMYRQLPFMTNEQTAPATGALVMVLGMAYFVHSVYFAKKQHELMRKAANSQVAVTELNFCDLQHAADSSGRGLSRAMHRNRHQVVNQATTAPACQTSNKPITRLKKQTHSVNSTL